MAAIIGLDHARPPELVAGASGHGTFVVANRNSPGQVVVSGERVAIEAGTEIAKDLDRTHRDAIIPRMGGTMVRTAFVGRVLELERLDAALGWTIHRDGVVVLCGGEAGIGKTRLVTEFAERARRSGAKVLVGGSAEIGPVGLPYGPFAEAVRCAIAGGCLDPARLHPGVVEQLAILVPDIRAGASAAQVDLAGLGQVRLFGAVLAAMEHLRTDAPVVLILEDLQWADRSTLDLLSFLVRNVETVPLLILTTIRTDGLDRASPVALLLAELARRPSVERLDLEPLDLPETTEYLRAILGEAPDPDRAHRVHRRSDGNPYFIEQLAWAHADDETDAVPSSLRDILLTQLSRQPGEVQDLLEAAAVAGPLADESLLCAVLGWSADEILEPLRVAVRGDLLSRSRAHGREVYGFRHALMGEAVEADLLAGERRHLHRRCAEALAVERPDDGAALAQWAARIAHHRERSGAIDETIAASIDAAIQAAAIAAHADAMEQYQRAIRLVSRSGATTWGSWDASDLFGRASACAAVIGEAREAARLSRLAVEHLPAEADPWRRGVLLTRLAEHLWVAGDAGFVETLTLAAEVIPADPPTAARADALISLGFYRLFQEDRAGARAVFEEARTVADAAGAYREAALVRSCLVPILMNEGAFAAGHAEFEIARDRLRRAAPQPEVAVVYMDLAAVASWMNHEEIAIDIARDGLKLMQHHGFQTFYGGALVGNGAEALVALGRLREARELLAMVESTPAGGYVDIAQRVSAARVYTALGDLARAGETLRDAAWPGDGDGDVGRHLRQVEAEWTLESGRPEEVEALARGGLHLPRGQGPSRDPEAILCWLAVRAFADLAERARARRDHVTARSLVERGEHFLTEAEALLATGSSPDSPMQRRVAAIVALVAAEATRVRGAPDPAAWQRAVRAWDGLNAEIRRLYAQIREVEARLELGHGSRSERAAATAGLAAAYGRATEMGAGTLERMAVDLARRARIDLASAARRGRSTSASPSAGANTTTAAGRRPGGTQASGRNDTTDPYRLTEREHEILALLAVGLTNRQIGDRLFISPKTAGVHVSNILGKLGVSSRIQAATLSHRLGVATADE